MAGFFNHVAVAIPDRHGGSSIFLVSTCRTVGVDGEVCFDGSSLAVPAGIRTSSWSTLHTGPLVVSLFSKGLLVV